MTSTEVKHKFTTKIRNDLRTVQGDTIEEYVAGLEAAKATVTLELEYQDLIKQAEGSVVAPAAVAAVQQVVPATPVVAAPAPWDSQPVPTPAQQQYAANVPQASADCAHGPRRKQGPYNNNGRMQYTLYCALNRDDPREKCRSTKVDA